MMDQNNTFERLKIKHSNLRTEIVDLEKQNKEMKEKLKIYESRKLGKVLMKFYTYKEKSLFFKIIINVVYFVCYFPLKIFELFIKKSHHVPICFSNRDIAELKRIIRNSSSQKIVFFLSPIEWNMILKQRPQHIAQYISSEGIPYFYMEQSKVSSVSNLDSNLYSVQVPNQNYDFIFEIVKSIPEKTFYFQIYSAEWTDTTKLLEKLREYGVKVLYEYVDELSPAISGQEIPDHILNRLENSLKNEDNTYIVATASKLYKDVSFYRKKNFALITNGVELEHFSKKLTKRDLPFKMLKIYQQNKPIIGYYGAIASWMDFELLKSIASARPDYNFLLVGLDYDGSLSHAGLEDTPNIHVLPPVKYVDLPRYGGFFDVCMIPFKINDVTESTSPIKLFEYMAMRKPVVTTNLPECRKYKSVMVAENCKQFIEMIDKGILLKKDAKYLDLLHKEAVNNTWEKKARDTIQLMS